jgi:hypothetical protein
LRSLRLPLRAERAESRRAEACCRRADSLVARGVPSSDGATPLSLRGGAAEGARADMRRVAREAAGRRGGLHARPWCSGALDKALPHGSRPVRTANRARISFLPGSLLGQNHATASTLLKRRHRSACAKNDDARGIAHARRRRRRRWYTADTRGEDARPRRGPRAAQPAARKVRLRRVDRSNTQHAIARQPNNPRRPARGKASCPVGARRLAARHVGSAHGYTRAPATPRAAASYRVRHCATPSRAHLAMLRRPREHCA